MKGPLGISGIFAVLFLLGISAAAFAQAPQSNARATKQVPEHVVYEFYFRRMAFFEDLAQKKEKDGLAGSPVRAVIGIELGINEAHRCLSVL